MIVFDLKCANDHVFEAWFKDSKAFEEQKEQGILECPVCGDRHIQKALSPIKVKRSTAPSGDGAISQEVVAKLVETFYKKVVATSEDVGTKFAAEALKMHYGVTEPRSIRGVATEEEEKMLKDEGVEFFRIPVPPKKEDKSN
ncbi:MAG: DUF1178 family protein [Thermodesulfobacteria bacterium]|nr:DUF1178 family protein [Thermodesulfobacteriota bacterium]